MYRGKVQVKKALLDNSLLNFKNGFSVLVEENVNYDVCQRPWGYYKILGSNKNFQSKVIHVNPQGILSLQSHEHRDEYWVVVYGNGIAQVDGAETKLCVGDTLYIPKGCKHRLANPDNTEYLQIVEVQLGDYFDEDDIIRYEDIYGRV